MPSLVIDRATEEDDEEIRSLLRRMPMEGDIRLTFEREPDSRLSATIEGDRHHAFVAKDAQGRIRGLCSRSVRPVWLNGRPARVGYLGQLRLEVPLGGSLRPIVDGFAACSLTRQSDELPFDLTSIMSDNRRARRVLERGLSGLPRYRQLSGFKTFLFTGRQRARRSDPALRIERASPDAAPRIASFLQSQYQRFQFAPVWSESDLASEEVTRDLRIDDFLVATMEERIVGCAALWDQSRFRQTVVRGYSSRLGRARHLVNLGMKLTGRPLLPEVGSPIRFGAISHFAVDVDSPDVALSLLGEIIQVASTKAFDYVVLGLADGHPLSGVVEDSLVSRTLSSILYTVHYDGADMPAPDGRPAHVEVATL